MMGFKSTVMYKKGELGERIVDEHLLGGGTFIPYAPVMDNAHVFDRLIASKDKRQLMVVEIKAIDARDFYPDTGISIKHYREYKQIQDRYNLDVWVLFVDAKNKCIYGNTLSKLDKPTVIRHGKRRINYPLIQDNFAAIGKKIIYFPLANMKRVKELNDQEVQELNEHNNKGYKQDLSWKKGYAEWKNNQFNT